MMDAEGLANSSSIGLIQEIKENTHDVGGTDQKEGEEENCGAGSKESSSSAGSSSDMEEEKPSCGSVIRNGIIEFSVEPIQHQLLCCLCEGLYKEPYTTIKCHHTFCKSCLRIGLQSYLGTPEHNCCPYCNTYLGGKSDIASVAVPDRVLETIIDKIFFPEITCADAQAEIEFYRKRGIALKQPTTTTAPTEDEDPSPNELMGSRQAESSSSFLRRGNKKLKQMLDTDEEMDSERIKIVFHLLPEENADPAPPLESPFLRTDGSIRIGQLKKYLRKTIHRPQTEAYSDAESPDNNNNNTNNNKYNNKTMDTSEERAVALLIEFHRSPERRPVDRDIEILCNSIPLGNELSVNFVWRTVWIDHSKKLTLFYRYADAKR
jgi:hypothetical protein